MNFLLSFRAKAALVLTLIAVLSSAASAWWDGLDLDFSESDSSVDQTQSERKRLDGLRQIREATNQRISLRETVVGNLIDKRMSLINAAEHFDAINQSNAGTLKVVRKEYRGATDKERAARQVLDHVRRNREMSADEREHLLHPLECEFQAAFGASP